MMGVYVMGYDPAQDVINFLKTQDVATEGTDMFAGPFRPVSAHIPANCLFVLATGGRSAERFLSGGAKIENRYPTVQVTVRWMTYTDGYKKAREVYDELNFASIGSYWNVKGQQSEPLFVGQGEDGNYRWSLNFELSIRSEVDVE